MERNYRYGKRPIVTNPRNEFEFQVSGRYAMYTTPQSKCSGDKSSYPVPTYEALKGLVKKIYWKPTFEVEIIKVRIMNPIRFESMGMRIPKMDKDSQDKSYYTYLKDPKYQVRARIVWNEAHPELDEDRNMSKHMAMMKRAIQNGGRMNPFLGVSECPAWVEPCKFGSGEGAYDNEDILPLGMMFHSFIYPNMGMNTAFSEGSMRVVYDDIKMRRGVIEFRTTQDIPFNQSNLVHVWLPDEVEYIAGRNFAPVEKEACL